jgi:ribonucleotide reductase alpha subunit
MEVFSETARLLLEQRYLKRREEGIGEPSRMLERVAIAVAEPARASGQDPGQWSERFLTPHASSRGPAQFTHLMCGVTDEEIVDVFQDGQS